MSREHLKDLLVQKGLAENPAEAQRLILAARVSVDGRVQTQAGSLVQTDARIEVGQDRQYVSRGGFKLAGALDDFGFEPAGLSCIDVGASTGGFTDCLLQRGAAHVVAVDVGYGQFDWKLRNDSRVTLFERTNIAKADPALLGAPFALLVADLSFTSLARLAACLAALVGAQGNCLTLVKPQFELPKAAVRNGVVHGFDAHVKSLEAVLNAFGKNALAVQAVGFSHLLGPKGNREFWVWAKKHGTTATINLDEVVQQAHRELGIRN